MSDAMRKARFGIPVRADPGAQLTLGEVVLPLVDVGGYRRAVFNIRQTAALDLPGGADEVDFYVDTCYDGAANLFSDSTTDVNGAFDAVTSLVVVDDGSLFEVGDIIRIENERMRVLSIATNDLTVGRGWDGDAVVGHADGLSVFLLQQSWVSIGNAHYAIADDTTQPTAIVAVGGPDPLVVNDISVEVGDDAVRAVPFGDRIRLRVEVTLAGGSGYQYECTCDLLSD